MKKIFQSTKNFFRIAKSTPQHSTIRAIVETVVSNNIPEEVEEVIEAPKPKTTRKKKVKEEEPKVEKVTKKAKKKNA